jgi:nucleoside-diphosphate-sugar epimerase
METEPTTTPILIVGATGHLGCLITKEALTKPTLQVNILVHDTTTNPEIVTCVEKAGGKVFKGDLNKPETLKEPTKGIHTVVSVCHCPEDENVLVEGQTNLVNACVENGVERFVPSDFTENYQALSKEEIACIPMIAEKAKFDEFLTTTKIPVLKIRSGTITEVFFDSQKGGLGYYGDVDFKHNLISYESLAKFVVGALTRKNLTGELVFTDESITVGEIADVYNNVRGADIEPKRLGSLEDLKKKIEERKKEGDFAGAEFYGHLTLVFDPRVKFEKRHNVTIPEVHPTSLSEFLEVHREVKLK